MEEIQSTGSEVRWRKEKMGESADMSKFGDGRMKVYPINGLCFLQ